MASKGKLLSIIAGLLVSSSSVAGVTVGVLHNKRKLDAKTLNLTNDIPENVRSLKILYTENQQLILDQINVQRKILRTEKSHIEIELKDVEFKFNPSVVPSVTISAKKSSKFLKGSVEIKFNKPNISSLIKEESRNLGIFEVRTIEKVIERLVEINVLDNKDFNAEKIKQNFDIQINEQQKTIKVKAKSDSIFYVGEVEFSYNLPQFSTLQSIETQINGLVDDQPDTILDKFFEINKEILEQDTVKITREQLKFELVENEAKITVENNINYEGSINVSYSVKTNIASLQLETNAGSFDSDEANAIIEAFINKNKAKLPGLTRNDFEVVSNSNGKLKIKVVDNNNSFQGEIEIDYLVKTDISTLELNTNAGAFNSNQANAIIEKFINDNKQKLPGFSVASFDILTNQNNVLKIKVKANNTQYQGTVEISYSVRTFINQVDGVQTNVGAFNSNNTDEIIQEFIRLNAEKLPGLTKENLQVVGSASNTQVTVKVVGSDKYQGQITLNFTVKTKIDEISGLNTNVGAFNSNNTNEIIQEFIRLNNQKLPGLTKENLQVVGSASNTQVTVKVVGSDKYQGQITLNFTVKTKIEEIDQLNTNAGSFDSKDADQIINAFISKNSDKLSGLTRNDLEPVGEIGENSLTVKVKNTNTKFQGQITINFKIRTVINSLTPNTNAGSFDSYNFDQIINAFIEKNQQLQGLTKSNFQVVGEPTANSVTVKVVRSDKYQGQITINFTIKTKIEEIDQLNTNAGSFDSKDADQIINAFISKNSDKLNGLTRNDLEPVGEIGENSLTVKVKNTNTKFQGTITIVFKIRIAIDSVVTSRNTGSFNSYNKDQIINAFIQNNTQLQGLTKDNFEVVGSPTANSVNVKVVNSDEFKGQITINFTIKKDISTLNLDKDAGAFDSTEKNAIIEAFIKKNKTQLYGLTKDDFDVISNNNGKLKITVKSDNTQYQGTVEISYSVRTFINQVRGVQTNVGAFNSNNTDEIIQEFIRLNNQKLPGLTKENLQVVGSASNTQVTVKVVGSDKYQGQITLNFTVKTKINEINGLNRNAGIFNSNTPAAIISQFIQNNKDKLPGLNADSFNVLSNGNGKLKIQVKADNNSFQGTVEINYSVRDQFNTIQKIVKDINDLKNNDTQSVLNRFIELNSNLLNSHKITRQQLRVQVNDNIATITVNGNDKYQGSIQVNLRLSKQTNDYLNVLEKDDRDSILKAINSLNKWNLSLNDLNIQVQGNTATITGKTEKNKKFIGTITAQFGLKATYKDKNKELTRIGFFKNSFGEWQIEKINEDTNKVVPNLPTFINSLESAFTRNRNATISGLESWDTSNVTNMKSMFQHATKFNQALGDKFITSKVTNMSFMFNRAHRFNSSLGNNFNTSNVTDMEGMFKEAKSFDQVLGENFNTSKVTNMKEMFYQAHKFNKSLGNFFDTSLVTTMESMFGEAKVFNGSLGNKFNTSKVTDMRWMFWKAEKFNQSLGNSFNTSQATTMEGMFQEAKAFNQVLGDKFNTSKVTNMKQMFYHANSFNKSLGNNFNTSQVTTMESMFGGARVFNQSLGNLFNTSKVTNMSWMFWKAEKFNQSLGNSFNTSQATTMEGMFKEARAFNQVLGDNFNTSNVTNMSQMFAEAKVFSQSLGGKFNTSKVTNMSWMFWKAEKFNQSLGNSFNTSQVTTMEGMFKEARAFNQVLGDNFNTSNVTNMSQMFAEAKVFSQLLGGKFNTSKVTDMSWMFWRAEKFNSSLGNDFNTSQVTTMEGMFKEARAFNQVLGDKFNTSKVTNMKQMFYQAHVFNKSLGNSFDTSKVTTMEGMFSGAREFNQVLGNNFNTSKVENMKDMFSGASKFNSSLGDKFDTSNVKTMQNMFANASLFNQSLGGNFNTKNVTNMQSMFHSAIKFNKSLGDKFDTSKVTTMQSMFHQAHSFNSSLGNKFDTKNVTNMQSMFDTAKSFNQSLGDKFDTSQVTTMYHMFYDAISFNQSLGNKFDTSQVTSMRLMFYNTPFNQSLGDKFDTSKVTNMQRMFLNAKSFNQSLGDKFDTSQVTNMERMFAGASSFNQDISHFNTSKVTDIESMFSGASSFNQNINTQEKQKADGSKYTAWDVSKVENMKEMFKNAKAFNQNISKWNVTISDAEKFKDFNSGANAEFKDQKLPEKIRNSLRTNS
ncbi:BspA family leucine-rich repeat surface protein [Mycoplasma yeatsii]|uniref:Surface protein n=1 Tax=Mycoplasma yeatsii TaxID=51365 RepID=A0ABU0ND54_9MOLU|nr:BspA family leucine-rich repeat surface protein [Mycoplasma yeatsii]MDQ0567381.1 surface protein [Mycoplasma yeatsii]